MVPNVHHFGNDADLLQEWVSGKLRYILQNAAHMAISESGIYTDLPVSDDA